MEKEERKTLTTETAESGPEKPHTQALLGNRGRANQIPIVRMGAVIVNRLSVANCQHNAPLDGQAFHKGQCRGCNLCFPCLGFFCWWAIVTTRADGRRGAQRN